MTTTIEHEFGARVMVDGFLLNNELTDFSFRPEVDGQPVANRVEPGKRPRSSMSPTLIFDQDHKLVAALGSAGTLGRLTPSPRTDAVSSPSSGARRPTCQLVLLLSHLLVG